jgi:uncharacterized protein YggE
MRRRHLVAAFAMLALAGIGARPVAAQLVEPQRPLVTVTGTAEVQVVPDLVDLSVGLETRERDLGFAFRDQENRVRQVLEVAKKFGVGDKDIRTAHVEITPVYDEEKTGRRLSYYQLRKSVGITLRDPSQYDQLLAGLLEVGVNQVTGVVFRHSNDRPYRDQAREMAVTAAKEKATAMAAKLGQQLGKAVTIDEIVPTESLTLAPGVANAMRDKSDWDGYGAPTGTSLALGQLVIRATVRVAFELK